MGNKADYEELSNDLKTGVTPHFVTHYDEIYKLALCGESDSSSSDSESSDSDSDSDSDSEAEKGPKGKKQAKK